MARRLWRSPWPLVAVVIVLSAFTTIVLAETTPWERAGTDSGARSTSTGIEETARVAQYVFSLDGKRVLGVNPSGMTAWIWDGTTGRLLHTLDNDNGGYATPEEGYGLFSPDGTRAVVVDGYGRGAIWDVASGRRLHTLINAPSTIFTPDGRRVLTASHEGGVEVLNVATGRTLYSMLAGLAEVPTAEFSRDGKLLLTASVFGLGVRIWDATSGRLLHVLRPANRASFSSDGTRIVTSSGAPDAAGGPVRIWDAASGRTLHVLRNIIPARYAVSPDTSLALTNGDGRRMRILNVASGRTVQVLPTAATYAHFTSDGKCVVTFHNYGGPQQIWDLASERLVVTVPPQSVFSPDSKLVVATNEHGTARIWDVGSGQLLHTLHPAFAPVFSGDGTRLLASNGSAGEVWIWDTASSRKVSTLRLN